jgi:exosortase
MASLRLRSLIGLALFAGVLLWAYWSTLAVMADKWSTDPQYSHGFLVPAFAAWLLWHRRALLADSPAAPSSWGLVLIGVGLAMNLAGAYIYLDALNMISILPVLAGLAVCYGGRSALRWAWPSIAFLLFMLPLPYRAEIALSHPLQRLATYCSTYALQTLGFAAVSEGNVIILDNARIGVVAACNGLGMLVTFVAMTTATVLVVRRSWIESILIVLSAIPIAVIANVTRITVTGILHAYVGGDVADMVFHDLAGWLMMPLALGMLWLELRMLSMALVEVDTEEGAVMSFGLASPVAPAAKARRQARNEAGLGTRR